MNDRVEKLIKQMKDKGLDAVLITSPSNLRYFSGFLGDSIYLIITKGRNLVLAPSMLAEQARLETKNEVIECGKGLSDKLSEVLANFHIKNLGFEDRGMTFFDYSRLSEKVNAEMVPLGSFFEELRMVKDSDEIANISAACSIGDSAFSYILGIIKPGITEKEIALEIEYYMRKNGAEAAAFKIIAASGIRGGLPHAEPTNKKLRKGDLVILDFGCKVNGYCSDMTRTVGIGEVSQEQRQIYNIVKEAQQMALDFILQGKRTNQVDNAVREYLEVKGYKDNFIHALGHGLGLDIHEPPTLSSNNDIELLSNMVIAVEPGIYIKDFGGVRIEDTVVVKENGVEVLTKSSKELIIL